MTLEAATLVSSADAASRVLVRWINCAPAAERGAGGSVYGGDSRVGIASSPHLGEGGLGLSSRREWTRANAEEPARGTDKTAKLLGRAISISAAGERAGLETHDIALAQAVVTIPIDPKFRSLNLAQAVAITAYEWRTAIADAAPPAFGDGVVEALE